MAALYPLWQSLLHKEQPEKKKKKQHQLTNLKAISDWNYTSGQIQRIQVKNSRHKHSDKKHAGELKLSGLHSMQTAQSKTFPKNGNSSTQPFC